MEHIGTKVKNLRLAKGMTLKELSSATELSIGFLSQFERDQTTIAIDSLQTIAEVFDVHLTYFISNKDDEVSPIVRSYSQRDLQILNSNHISKILVNDTEKALFLPRLIEILPKKDNGDPVNAQTHKGVEFIYVLEGVLDLLIEGEEYSMYPGDAAYFESSREHNWINNTTKTVKLLSVNSPNTFCTEEK